MSEKVLGFKEKDAEKVNDYAGVPPSHHYEISEDKLVPVVSIEWLEKYFQKHRFCDEEADDLLLGFDLIEEAKRQAGGKKAMEKREAGKK